MGLTWHEQRVLHRTERELSTSAPRLAAELAAFAGARAGQPRPTLERAHRRRAWLDAVLSQLLRLAARGGHVLLGAGVACADEYGAFARIQPGLGEDDPGE
jgi:Protein of unknown function (DUF3040)